MIWTDDRILYGWHGQAVLGRGFADPKGVMIIIATGKAVGRNPWLELYNIFTTLKGLNKILP